MTDPSHFLFFSSRVESGEAFLDKEEARHVFSVLRKLTDDAIMITDGKGSVYECTVHEQSPEGARCAVIKTIPAPAPKKNVSVYAGLPEKEAFGELCQSLAALGASRIIPLECEYCQDRWWPAWEKQAQRLTKKMIAGIKQAKSAWLPLLCAPQPLAGALGKGAGALMLAADESGVPFADVIDRIKNAAAVSCFVGPPGGFSPEEIDQLKSAGVVFVSLSQNRLRTELSAMVLCGGVMMTS
jgi:16S rRNA (uracil1498-N3)-methyltransferase